MQHPPIMNDRRFLLYRWLFIGITLCLSLFTSAQQIDLVINKSIYISHFSKELKVPLYVEYDLYQGGGNSSRAHMRFKEELGSARSKDYKKSGFDKGHLVNAEDFAFDPSKEVLTFSFYNCFPQVPRLNRGSWKSWETTIRKESQKWPLKIYVGGIYGSKKSMEWWLCLIIAGKWYLIKTQDCYCMPCYSEILRKSRCRELP